MRQLYSFGIRLYGFSIKIISLLGNEKAKNWINGRKKWAQELKKAIPKDKKLIWFHCASLGEFEQARPLIEKLKEEDKKYFILLSFFSPSGFIPVKKKYKIADHICYLPLDSRANAKKFLKVTKPHIVIFTKYEFWYNFIHEINKLKIDLFLISGIFRDSQIFFKIYGKWFVKHLRMFSMVFTQDKNSTVLLRHLEIDSTPCGDTRFDRVKIISESKKTLPLNKKENTLIFGSSWDKENEFAVRISEEINGLRLIIAPHEIDTEKIAILKSQFNKKTILWSELEKNPKLDYEVLIVDQIGLLSALYSYADIAIIGGGFGKGIHNILEAAVYGIPVIFGPNYLKFKEASDLVDRKGAISVKSYEEYKSNISKLVSEPELYNQYSQNASTYVNSMIGATQKIYDYLSEKNL